MNTKLENQNIKSLYESSIETKYKNDYEFYRWFTNQRLRADFYMNYQAIISHVTSNSFQRCLEFGPGPGTWTQTLFRYNPTAHYSLVDISEAMYQQFKLSMREHSNVEYIVTDIKSYSPSSTGLYDMFFSSRALEYLEDKKIVLSHIYSLLQNDAIGVIITKNSSFGLVRKPKDSRFQHTGQLNKEQLGSLLKEIGFSNVEFYPVIIRVPIIDRVTTRLSEFLFRKYHQKKLESGVLERLTESYLVKFSK